MKNILLGILITVASLHAVIIEGEGYAETSSQALKESLADLSNKIFVNVKSEAIYISSSISNDTKENIQKLIQISSSLPIIGFEQFTSKDENGIFNTTTTLSTQNSLPSYILELNRINKAVSNSQKNLEKKSSKNEKYLILENMLNDIESFNKNVVVATMLRGEGLPILETSLSEVKVQLQKLKNKAPSIDLAAKLLTKNFTQEDIYILPVKLSGSSEVTQFAKILKDTMSKNLKTVKYSNDAKYFLRGNYELLNKSIFITLKLSDIYNNNIKTVTLTIDEEAYQNIQYKASTKNFDESINSDNVKSGELSVNIGFKGYNRANGIDLVDGDVVDIILRANKPICYFLMGHTLSKDKKFSYILPIGSDDTPFINRVNGSDVNRNVTIIQEIPISSPFGSENLQVFSSTVGKNGTCSLVVPRCSENDDGYCVVNGKPNKIVRKTRGLNMKKKKSNKKLELADNSISFTTFKE